MTDRDTVGLYTETPHTSNTLWGFPLELIDQSPASSSTAVGFYLDSFTPGELCFESSFVFSTLLNKNQSSIGKNLK